MIEVFDMRVLESFWQFDLFDTFYPTTEQLPIINLLSSFLFLPALGFNNSSWILGAEWYIGYMLFAMVVIYPVLLKWFKTVSRYVAPIVGLILYGYLAKNYNTIQLSDRMIRAFAGLLMGVSALPLSEFLKEKTSEKKSILCIFPLLIIVSYFLYINYGKSASLQPIMVVFLWLALIVVFAGRSLFSSSNIVNNPFIYFLGRVSLPIYLIQNFTRVIVQGAYTGRNAEIQLLLEVCITVVAGIIAYYLFNTGKKITSQSKNTKRVKTTLVCCSLVIAIFIGIGCTIGINSNYESSNTNLKNENQFIIYYYENEDVESYEASSLVNYGTKTQIMTIDELGFTNNDKSFAGWKVYRPDKRQWRIFAGDEATWSRWYNETTCFDLYQDGCFVSQTVPVGHSVHMYAQWE